MKNFVRLKPLSKATNINPDGIFLLPNGYINDLAKLCGCSRETVRNALRKNQRGEKADLVRRIYRAKYMPQETVLCE